MMDDFFPSTHHLYMKTLFLLFFSLPLVFTQELVLGQQERLNSTVDLDALYDLRRTLSLRDWPRRADPCTNWTGVSCQSGRVVGIDLSGLRRTLGRSNASFTVNGLRNLTRLSSFNSTGFALPGEIPDWFGSELPASLSVLDLRLSFISGSIPASLGNLVGLRKLSLSGNLLVGSIPWSLGKLANLTRLDLSSNGLNGSIPSSLGELRNLKFFSLAGNSFTGALPASFENMSSLEFLNLGNNSFSGRLSENILANLSRLNSITLSNNKFSGSLPASLWTTLGLRFIDFSHNYFTGKLPVAASSFNASGAVLNLSHNYFYFHLPPGAENLIHVSSSLDISYNYFKGEMPFNGSTKASVEQNCFDDTTGQRSSTDCSAFYSGIGSSYNELPNSGASPPSGSDDRKPPPSNGSRKGNKYKIYIIVAVAAAFLLLAIVLFMYLCFLRKRGSVSDENGQSRVTLEGGLPTRTPNASLSTGDYFSYDQLLKITSGFSVTNLIKNGHSGDLYRGNLTGGAPVVVKKIDMNSLARESYHVELEFVVRASHTRLVPYLGHCSESDNEKLFVYKYMPNADLATAFYAKSGEKDQGLKSLDWITRLKIASGVAEALFYLHHECVPPIVHRDVQASSILLDDKFEVRLGSLSQVCHQEDGGRQTVITRFLRSSQFSGSSLTGLREAATCTYDVYCFGKVLLELVTGRLDISSSDDATASELMENILPHISIHRKELLADIVDPTLVLDEDFMEEVWAMAIVAKSCLNPTPSSRPQIKHILKALENPLKVAREGIAGSARLRNISSQGSWNISIFGSWRSSPEATAADPAGRQAA